MFHRMTNLLYTLRRDDHPIRLNLEFRLDFTWWCELFHRWDGLSFFLMPEWAPIPDFQVSSDAAGTLGCGARSVVSITATLLIANRELFPIVMAAYLWSFSGPLGGSSSSATMSQRWLFYLLVPSGTLNWGF